MAGDLDDQHRVLGGDPGVLGENTFHSEALIVADSTIGPGDAHENKGEGVEVVRDFRVERIQSCNGSANHERGFRIGAVF